MQLSGNILDYFVVFWGGVLVSFSPCVYPVLPITAAFLAGVNTKGTKLMGFTISSVYVLGLAITYSGFAVFAALTGKMFGQAQNNPVFFFIVSGILILFSLIMLDKIRLPALGVNIQQKIRPKNLWMVLLFGMAAGLVVAPCTTAILGPLLLYIGSRQNIIHAVSLMFVFSYGVGFSLILVGTFSHLLSHLPKSGLWLTRIKQFSAFILLAAAIYFLVHAIRLI